MSRLQQTLLITGGGRGIGAATARLAARSGFAVCINYRKDADSASQLADAINDAGGQALALQGDVSSEQDVERLFATAQQHLPPLVGLINSAGVVDRLMPLAEMDGARLKRMFDVNVVGTLLCAREAVRRLSTTRGGSGGGIVNLSSVASRLGSPAEFVDYAAAKGAIDSFTIGLAKEVAAEGIRVNAVRPGLIRTDIHADSGDPGRADRLRIAIPMQRVGQPEEVARTILWLLSAEASYVTGAIIDVSGGR